MHEKINANTITCKDGATACKCIYNKCRSFICNCSFCSTRHAFCNDRKLVNRHRRQKHRGKTDSKNTIEENEVKENTNVSTALTGGFDNTDIKMELNYINYLNDLNHEEDKHWEFIKYLNKDTARHYLVATLEDKRFTNVRCENLSLVDINL